MRISFDCASTTGRGLVREENQDSLFAAAERGVFCVADGMGGGQGGAKASEIACSCVSSAAFAGDDAAKRREIAACASRANGEIRAFAANAGFKQMATTLALLSFDRKTGAALTAHIGDSRIYRLRRGVLERLTRDHTLSTVGPYSHILTRAVGADDSVEAEYGGTDARGGDVFLLCTDGVYDMLDDAAIEFILAGTASPREACSAIENAVIAAGACDNYTAIVVSVAADLV